MSDYLSKDDDTEIEMRDTPEGVAVSLRMIEDNMVMAGTTFYLTLQQVKDMGAWLSERSEAEQAPIAWRWRRNGAGDAYWAYGNEKPNGIGIGDCEVQPLYSRATSNRSDKEPA